MNIELHDARLVSIATDFVSGRATLSIEYYPRADSSTRRPASIRFLGVTRLNEAYDLEELHRNAGAGNISYWTPADGDGTTYVYFSHGFLAVTAVSWEFSEE
jgi:hypothetical protein